MSMAPQAFEELLTLWLADQVTAVVAKDKELSDKVLNIAKYNLNQKKVK